jgi:hypothetical protein
MRRPDPTRSVQREREVELVCRRAQLEPVAEQARLDRERPHLLVARLDGHGRSFVTAVTQRHIDLRRYPRQPTKAAQQCPPGACQGAFAGGAGSAEDPRYGVDDSNSSDDGNRDDDHAREKRRQEQRSRKATS